MKTVYVIMVEKWPDHAPHSVFFSRKEAMKAILKLEKRNKKRFYYIERAKMEAP